MDIKVRRRIREEAKGTLLEMNEEEGDFFGFFLFRVMLPLLIGLARGWNLGKRNAWAERRTQVSKMVVPVPCSWSSPSRLTFLSSGGEMETILQDTHLPFHCLPKGTGRGVG